MQDPKRQQVRLAALLMVAGVSLSFDKRREDLTEMVLLGCYGTALLLHCVAHVAWIGFALLSPSEEGGAAARPTAQRLASRLGSLVFRRSSACGPPRISARI